jgi:rhodanese-related sulfurtransferase
VKTIPMNEFVSAYDRRVTLIDVREPHEYAQGHVPGAALIPLGQLPHRVQEVPKNDTVYVICQSGNRSKQGAEALAAHGVNAVSVDEGTLGWIGRRREVATGLAPR